MPNYRETVLYYHPDPAAGSLALKGVLVQMGVRVRRVTPGQVTQTVGYLAGLSGFEEQEVPAELPKIEEEMLVMHQFTSQRIDVLLSGLKRARVPKIGLKAVVTPTNSSWTFYRLYEEIKKEREAMEEKP